ncbi:condensation domain-containing protein [Gorillibacterium massiliense]|uniref:condensation domain-containing protein n=1 Tax=Gorillibacterium massiliense TaxID=1280390 RepID=UPI0004BAC09B|nr:condensation domain-containing protein [Gorillibacterium massiliense]
MERRLSIITGKKQTTVQAFPCTLPAVLEQTAARFPQSGIIHVAGDGTEDKQTYADLLADARKVLTGLQALHLQAGDRIILEIHDSRKFLSTFWGCLLGGIIPAPLHTPSSFKADSDGIRKTMGVWNLLGKPPIVADERVIPYYERLADSEPFAGLQTISAESLMAGNGVPRLHNPAAEDIAFVQFSSGSTGAPKGVQLTHRNLIHNACSINEYIQITGQDFCVNWMPFYHDMGLVAMHLAPLFAGINQAKLAPDTFLAKPVLLLSKISEHRGTISGSPNFGFEWMCRNVPDDELAKLDLRSLRLFYNGAEHISKDTSERFNQKFSSCGLRPEANLHVYGMAEASVAIAAAPVGSLPFYHLLDQDAYVNEGLAADARMAESRTLCTADEGYPLSGITIRVVNDQDEVVEENRIGHIQIQGPNVTQGYYRNDAVNAQLFQDGFLRTGDMGFIRDGRIVITGRMKDLIVINGHNHYAHDLDEMLLGALGLMPGDIVTVGAPDPLTGRDVFLVFVRFRGTDQIFEDIRASVQSTLRSLIQAEADCIYPVKMIPKTTSGKIERYKLIKWYLENGEAFRKRLKSPIQDSSMNESLESPTSGKVPKGEAESPLHEIWARVLGIDAGRIREEDSFTELGGTSLKAMQLAGEVQARFGPHSMDVADIFECETFGALSDYLQKRGALQEQKRDEDSPPSLPIRQAHSLRFPLSRGQQQLYFQYLLNPADGSYNVPVTVALRGSLDALSLQKALDRVVHKHEILHVSIVDEAGVPVQQVQAGLTVPLEQHVWRATAEDDKLSEWQAYVEKDKFKPFVLENPPLMRCRLFDLGNGEYRLYVNIHHIIADGWSMGKLFSDWFRFYDEEIQPKPTTDGGDSSDEVLRYSDFVAWEQAWMDSDSKRREEAYWFDRLHKPLPELRMPVPRRTNERVSDSSKTDTGGMIPFHIDAVLNRQISDFAKASGCTSFAVLLAAYFQLLHRCTGQQDLIVGIPIAGRTASWMEPHIGLFLNKLPIRVELNGLQTARNLLASVKTRLNEAYRHQSYPFDAMVRQLNPERSIGRSPIFATMFNLVNVPLEASSTELQIRLDDMSFEASKYDFGLRLTPYDGGLRGEWQYRTDLLDGKAAKRLADQYMKVLQQMVASVDCPLSDFDLSLEEDHLLSLQLGLFERLA